MILCKFTHFTQICDQHEIFIFENLKSLRICDFVILIKLTVRKWFYIRKQIKPPNGKQEFTELSWYKEHHISVFPMYVMNVYQYDISVNSCFHLGRVDPRILHELRIEIALNHLFITYWNILRDSKYPEIDDFGTKIDFESWVNLPQIIKSTQPLFS